MTGTNFVTSAQNTWCPGCGNFSIQHTLKNVFADMEKSGTDPRNIVLVTGIGCHAKIADYMNVNSFYSIHGRAIPVATGIKLANPDLTVICCVGDGDTYAEGLDHLIFAAKRNIDITVLVHDNRVYGLTVGQYTPTSPLGFRGKSTPEGTHEHPMNPIELMLASGATYVARGYTRKMDQLKSLVSRAIAHRGFSFIDILQICATFFPVTDSYNARVYDLPSYDTADFSLACEKAREWDYNADSPLSLGVFYEKTAGRPEGKVDGAHLSEKEREQALYAFLASRQ
ncbi:MAG TPA: thiamine pyrophosphate-dependent enzyme [Methanoregulaceae archaeon]|nr:thiamine pyrophosphate-dependent enzyme [Methanoregulaceae archaeon]